MEPSNLFQNDWLKDHWLRLLGLVDYCNHAVKEGQWYEEDTKWFYDLKDLAMERVYREPPAGAEVTLKKVPYKKAFDQCKATVTAHSLEKCEDDPDQAQTRPHDLDVQEKLLIEMEVTYAGRMFCFHIPTEKAVDWGVDMNMLDHKAWISSCEFHRISFKGVFEEIRLLLNLTQNQSAKKEMLSRGKM